MALYFLYIASLILKGGIVEKVFLHSTCWYEFEIC